MKSHTHVIALAMCIPFLTCRTAAAADGEGTCWTMERNPIPVHTDRYTSRGQGRSFADCGVTATCDQVEASAWGRSYLFSGAAAHQDAGVGFDYTTYRWACDGYGELEFEGKVKTRRGEIRALDGMASIGLGVSVELENTLTPPATATGHGFVTNFSGGGSVGGEAEVPGPGSVPMPVPLTVSISLPTSAPAAAPHTIVIPEDHDRSIGSACLGLFSWQVRTESASTLYVEWTLGGTGYARGRILRGDNVWTNVVLGDRCQ
ncbi:MAG: hypothetical protein GY711_15865 [bacterium]|nr:hypothetical protein [bacterium]